MRAASLHAILLGAVGASIAACGGATNGPTPPAEQPTNPPADNDGGSSVDAGGPLTSPFACTSAEAPYDALRAAAQVDYLARLRVDELGGPDASPPEPKVEVEVGTKCAAASDPAACASALAALRPSTYLFPSCGGCVPGGSYLVFTKGDEVAAVTTKTELMSLLGTVDRPAEAWIVASVAGYTPSCSDGGWIRTSEEGYVLLATKRISDCPIQTANMVLLVRPDGTVEVLEQHDNPETGACIGRRPAGLLAPRRGTRRRGAAGEHFAKVAHLEAASVDAFRVLGRELAAHGAPRPLLRAAERAAKDEIRHARAMARIARRYGGKVPAVRVAKGPVRPLFDIALENAVEGCVRETYGALEGMWQAQAAADPVVRDAMKGIAQDEVRHGALAWEVAAWLDTKLSASERARVREARAREVDALTSRVRRAPDPALAAAAGLPSAARAAAFVAHLRETLWRA